MSNKNDALDEEIATEVNEDAEEQEVNPLSMSDEEIENMPLPSDPVATNEEPEDTDDTNYEEPAGEDPADDESESNTNRGEEDEHGQEQEESTDEEGESTSEETQDVAAFTGPTPEQQLAALFSPFKANGKQMQVSSIEDAQTLMQMGANYNKKMAGLKPNLKLMKMLSNNDLLDEDKLTYLIDLEKKNPAAIKRLLKDANIDPLEMDMDENTEYTPGAYTVNEHEVDLEMALDGIKDTPTFRDTVDIISNKWDDSSKEVLLKNPSVIPIINDHVANGMYGEIETIIDNERALGRLTDMSDLEAYKHVGDVLQASGAFNPQGQQMQQQANVPMQQSYDATQAQDPQLRNRKKAAASTKSRRKTKAPVINPLEMSDEEFEKMAAPVF